MNIIALKREDVLKACGTQAVVYEGHGQVVQREKLNIEFLPRSKVNLNGKTFSDNGANKVWFLLKVPNNKTSEEVVNYAKRNNISVHYMVA